MWALYNEAMARISPIIFETHTGHTGVLRNPEPYDAAPLLEALETVVEEGVYLLLAPRELSLSEQQERSWLDRFNEASRDLYLVAVIDRQLVGGLSLTASTMWRRRHTATLGMFVTQPWRGQGVGTHLMQAALQWACQCEALEKICLEVYTHNTSAIRLYRRMGFEEEGTRKGMAKLDEQTYADELLMALNVNENESTWGPQGAGPLGGGWGRAPL